ncbi:uncharacterized protein DMAD_02078 [Drosophila madeirensis]|uniref:Uncharacterized protein n=1 Tax=Drosophila madeirensis TaxID=30013 RepID=A0AAU9G4I5_DROMD
MAPATPANPQPQAQSQTHPQSQEVPATTSSQLLLPPQLRKTASVRESHDPTALAKRRSRLQELRAASSSSSAGGGGDEAVVSFSKRDSKRNRRRGGATASGASSSSSGSPRRTEAAMRKSQSLDAAESLSLASIQSPLWVTLTNARTIEELAQQKL